MERELIKTINGIKLFKDKNKHLTCEVMDGDGDFFKVSFKYDNCATIDGDGMTYSCFESQTLIALGELVLFADDWYNKNLE